MSDFGLNPTTPIDLDKSPIDLRRPLRVCSAQDIFAALMLKHPNRSLMQQVLANLYEHPMEWKSFFLGSYPIESSQDLSSGGLACLRDVRLGWNADTLYILSPDAASAKTLQSRSRIWNGLVTVHSPEQTLALTAADGVLLTLYWQPEQSEKRDYLALYDSGLPPTLPSAHGAVCTCTTQMLLATLMHRGQPGLIDDPHTVLNDLYSHCHLWRSFVPSSASFDRKTSSQGVLRGLPTLPNAWYADRLYIWAWEESDIFELRELAERWDHDQFQVYDECEAADLLNLPEEVWLVEISWI